MNKKGFTLIELLTVIVIIGIVTGIGIPIYNNVRNSANEKLYQSKVKAIETAAISFAEETNQNIFNVKDLIENGKLSPDNQTGEYIDPRNNKDMKCNIVNVIYDNNNYYANLTENDACMSEAELQNLYGMFSLHVYTDKNLTKKIDNWTSNGVVYVSYEWKSMYQGYERYNPTLTYFGNGVEDTCNNKKCFRVESDLIEDSTVSLTMDIVVDNKNISNTSSVNVRIDKEKPSLVAGSLTYSSKDLTNENVLVSFDLTDGLGSGLDSYAVATDCSNVTYEKVNDSHISKSLSNGDYYICIKDKVGNISDQSDSNKIHIDNIDKSGENITGLDVVSSKSGYNALDAIIKIDMGENTSGLKMCISETGYMKDCSFVGYASQVNHHFASYGTKYTIYVTIEDAAGNLTNKQKDYTTYTECLSGNYVRKDYSSWGSCSKKCGTGTQSRTYNNVDKNTNKVCQSNVIESQNCNTMTCCSSKSITSYSGWGGCSKTCGGGTQTRTGYYTSNYDGSSCGTTTESRSCNTQSCEPTYQDSTAIACDENKFRAIVNDTAKFRKYIEYQSFRDAMYDCAHVRGSMVESILSGNKAAVDVLRNSSRTILVSGHVPRGSQCNCKESNVTGKNSSSCDKPKCDYSNGSWTTGNLYNGRVLVLSVTSTTVLAKNLDDDGYGHYEPNSVSSGEYWYEFSIQLFDKNKNYVAAGNGGECNKGTNGLYNTSSRDRSASYCEEGARICSFQDGLHIGLIREHVYDYEKFYRYIYDRFSGNVYAKIFII